MVPFVYSFRSLAQAQIHPTTSVSVVVVAIHEVRYPRQTGNRVRHPRGPSGACAFCSRWGCLGCTAAFFVPSPLSPLPAS